MAIVDVIMPKLGESIMEATVLKWHKKPGDYIKLDETMLDIATDKVDSEVPSTAEGTITEILFSENDVVPIGTVIARIQNEASDDNSDTETEQSSDIDSIEEDTDYQTSDENTPEEIPYTPSTAAQTESFNQGGNNNGFYSPLVLNIAKSEGVSMSELEHIIGTGNEGRVTKKDILQFVEDKKAGVVRQPVKVAEKVRVPEPAPPTFRQPKQIQEQETPAAEPSPFIEEPAATTPAKSSTGNVEIIEMDRMRKLIAKHMVDSKHTSPHVTSFAEADVTNMVLWRERVKKEFEKQNGARITFTPLFIECVTKVIKRYPYINCSLDGDKIILKKDINIGMATALPSGNLIVPVIKNADYLNLVGLSKSVNTMADNARNNKLKSDDISGGTFTITNVGTFGSLMGTPIINQPQVAILAVGAIKKAPGSN